MQLYKSALISPTILLFPNYVVHPNITKKKKNQSKKVPPQHPNVQVKDSSTIDFVAL
jgi:hypothetical protein